jgi:hypothetical protein
MALFGDFRQGHPLWRSYSLSVHFGDMVDSFKDTISEQLKSSDGVSIPILPCSDRKLFKTPGD